MEIAIFWIVFAGLIAWWAAAWGRSVGWALIGALILSPLVWAVVLMVLGRAAPAPEPAHVAPGRARIPTRSRIDVHRDAEGRIVCPTCAAPVNARPGMPAGGWFECANCAQELRLAFPPKAPEPVAPTLRPCPACARDISLRATACPHCGDPLGA